MKQAKRSGAEADVLELTNAQAACLSSPIRSRIFATIHEFAPVSAGEVTKVLGAKEKLVYYHVKLLLEAGLIRQCGERAGKTKKEAVYEPISKRFRWACDPKDPEAAEIDRKRFRINLNNLIRDRERMVSENGRQAAMQALRCRLSPEDHAELLRRMKELSAWASSRDQKGKDTTSLTTFLFPLE